MIETEGEHQAEQPFDEKEPNNETPNDSDETVFTKSNLIVNFIPQSVDEIQLRNLFEPYGGIESLKIVKDRITDAHMGYGFVKYKIDDHAQFAISALNGFAIGDKSLKVGVARPRSVTGGKTNLYVSGLPSSYSRTQLEALFSSFGELVECRVLYEKSGGSRQIGFVRFDTHTNAMHAIDTLHGQVPPGGTSPVYVKFAIQQNAKDNISRQQQQQQQLSVATAQMLAYANLVNSRSNAANIYQNLISAQQQQSYGYIRNQLPFTVSASQRYNPIAGQPGAAAELAYSRAYQQALIEHMRLFKFQQPQQTVYQQQRSLSSDSCIFVFHLPHEATEQDLRTLFSSFGEIQSVKINVDPSTGKPKGFGFVNFASHEEAEKAINELDGTPMGNKYLKLSFKK